MLTQNKIYLDYGATTPVDPQVITSMTPYFTNHFGNPSSIHTFGQKAEAAAEQARISIAIALNCQPNEVIFTSCGSESDNLALRGAALAARKNRNANHLLISPVEHHAVLNTAIQLAEIHGFELEYLPVDHYGLVTPADVASRLRPDTAIVSVIYANNEIGTINPIAKIGAICQARGIPFHTDAVQAAPHIHFDIRALNVDLLSIAAHKFYGPKGVGALFVRSGTPILAVQTGGGQESGLRSGTLNVANIVGMADAFDRVRMRLEEFSNRHKAMRDLIIERVISSIPDTKLTGHPQNRLPNHASFLFKGVDGNLLLMLLDDAGFACSSGSACKTGDPEPSDVLLALSYPHEWAFGSLRITLGRQTTQEEINSLLAILPAIVAKARQETSPA
ncbi:MAG: cysteine desulfurase [Anaerolineae bacterium]|nr:cysteine desulfurase [Anaerolineae bacterium]